MKNPASSVHGGFTLIEMILTLAIFLLLASSVFGIFGATLQSASMLQDDQARADQTEAMSGWLRHNFLLLPSSGSVVSLRREGVPFDVSDVVWDSSSQYNALDLHLQANGHYTLRLAVSTPTGETPLDSFAATRTTFIRQILNDDPALSWRTLLRDVTAADWRFRKQNDPDWQEAATGDRELFVQFTFQLAGESKDTEVDCWIPPIIPAASLAPVTVTANP